MMKSKIRILSVLLLALSIVTVLLVFNTALSSAFHKGKTPEVRPFKDGDLIFQTSHSGQSLAVQYATHSKYTHCGLLFNDNGKWMVYEAVGPVRKYPFKDWIAMGDSNYYVVRRLKNADSVMTPTVVQNMRAACNKRMGVAYDPYFGWNDSLIYCSELVWKAYNESTGLEVGHTRPMKEFDLTHPVVKKIMKERYGDKIPYEEPMISPGDIHDSELLTTVSEGVK
ncbi:MAG: YiiX family permuted papain-like enzyme [Bacteroidia bacterium]|nr:YiiX family permuted papain-like enzyme [Bacteroidia bacterium]